MRRVVINGKFQSQRQTGVQRVSHALTAELIKLSQGRLKGQLDVSVAVPNGFKNAYPNHPYKPRLKGALWEQLELPIAAGKDILLNLSNVAPIIRSGDVVMIHDAQAFISPKSYSPLFRLYYQKLQPHIASRAATVLTVSDYAARCLDEVGIAPRQKIEVIHNGVDHILSMGKKDDVLDRLGLRGRPFLAALGSVQHHKNIKTLLAAAAQLDNPEARIVLIGSATLADYEAQGMVVGKNVCLAGHISDEEMRSVVENAQAFLFPSLTEGFGLPPLEAMLLGTPAIVAPCGAMPELCGESAINCDAEDPRIWANSINNVLADTSLREHYSKLGIERARNFTWEAAGERLAEILLRYV